MKKTTVHTLQSQKRDGIKFACSTAYDASFATQASEAGMDVLLVGDSLGSVVQGHSTTLPVTLDDMCYHTRCVARGATTPLIIGDMPFMSYTAPHLALDTAKQLMQAGAHMVKLEGGAPFAKTIRALCEHGIPVCAHIGLTPQSVHKLGGYKVQGKEKNEAEHIFNDAVLLEEAGADLIVLECVPAELATRITERLTIPTIGIGAGPDCDAQILVLYDLLGITPGKQLSFSHDFLTDTTGGIPAALRAYVNAVKEGTFPTHRFKMNEPS